MNHYASDMSEGWANFAFPSTDYIFNEVSDEHLRNLAKVIYENVHNKPGLSALDAKASIRLAEAIDAFVKSKLQLDDNADLLD